MNRTMNTIAITIATAALSTTAFAGGDKHKDMAHAKDKASFTELDADNSGTVTPSEVSNADNEATSEYLTSKWSELDTNQDGALDRTEFARFEPVMDENRPVMEPETEE